MGLRQMFVALAALVTATIGIAQQGGQAVPTIHIGTLDFANGRLTLPEAGLSKAIPGFSPLWNADGTRLLYLSRTGYSGGIRTTLNVESNGTTRELVSDVSIGAMSVTTD